MGKERRQHSRNSRASASRNTKSRHRKSVRGRRSKEQEQEILNTHGAKLAEIFRKEPLRDPVDPTFTPYYQRVLQGDVRAISEYCDAHWEKGDCDSSFFEFLGRLFAVKFYKISAGILRNIERRGVLGFVNQRTVFDSWYQRLKPRCDEARQFARAYQKSTGNWKRGQLWDSYISKPGGPKFPSEQCKGRHRFRAKAIQRLRRIHISKVSRKFEAQNGSLLDRVNEFGSFHLLPKDIFFDLAITKIDAGRPAFRFTPSAVARKWACQLAGISESTVSHWKNMGK